MSEATKNSWWVPFEIGMAAQVDMPTASYLTSSVKLPDYLEYWPRLKSTSDVATYVSVRRSVAEQLKRSYPYSYSYYYKDYCDYDCDYSYSILLCHDIPPHSFLITWHFS